MRNMRRSAILIGVLALLGISLWLQQTPEVPPDGMHAPERGAQVAAEPHATPRPETAAAPPLLPSATPVDVVPAAQLHALHAQMQQCRQQLHAQQQALRQHQQELTRLTRQQAEEPRVLETVSPDEPGEFGDSQEDREAGQAMQLEAALAVERRDPQWSQMAVEQIAAAVEQSLTALGPEAGSGSALSASSCYATLCRLVLEHNSREAMEHFSEEFQQQLPWAASAYFNTQYHADDSVTVVLYLSREGYPLPQIDR